VNDVVTRFVPDHAGMIALGRELASALRAGDVLLLHGDLGAGKTTLTQGIAGGLAVAGTVHSPTFALVAEHSATDADGTPVTLYHLDLYRLTDEHDLEGIGYEQYLAPAGGISVIEWPERAGSWLPDRFWLVRIRHAASGGRDVVIERRDSQEPSAPLGIPVGSR